VPSLGILRIEAPEHRERLLKPCFGRRGDRFVFHGTRTLAVALEALDHCKNGKRCLEHMRFDVMWRGKRYRMPVNDFAIPRMEPGKQRPIQSMEEARGWERLFIGEVKAGRDPRRAPSRSVQVGSQIGDVAAFLDAYWERCLKPAGLRSLGSVRSQIAVLKEHLGHLPLASIEDPDEINRFKTESDYAEDVELASVHRVLERLRAAINWGLAQTPPLFARSPFHRFGVRLNKKADCYRPLGRPKCRFANARPEADLRYFSNRAASRSVGNSIETTSDHGRCRTVWPQGPSSCHSRRSRTLLVIPT
jgi:hypothetical protein